MIPCETPPERIRRREPLGFRECQRFATLRDCEVHAPEMVKAIAERCQTLTPE